MYGGDSSEWEISVLSGQNVALHINRDRYEVYEILMRGSSWRVVKAADGGVPDEQDAQVNKDHFSFCWNGKKVLFDVVFVMIHGTPGEDGILQSYFESLHIPFTSSSSVVSALAFDKYACKCALRNAGINMAKELVIRKNEKIDEQEIVDALGLPLFIKPNSGGSSFGASKVKRIEEVMPAIVRAFSEGTTVLAEEFLEGRELTNGILKTASQTVKLPVTEIVSKNEFFDYQAKYQGASREITPAPIPDSLKEKVQHLTSKIYEHLGCKGFVRMDYIVRGADVVFLEVNTIPGMSSLSIIPQQAAAAGISMSTFLEWLIEDAFRL